MRAHRRRGHAPPPLRRMAAAIRSKSSRSSMRLMRSLSRLRQCNCAGLGVRWMNELSPVLLK